MSIVTNNMSGRFTRSILSMVAIGCAWSGVGAFAGQADNRTGATAGRDQASARQSRILLIQARRVDPSACRPAKAPGADKDSECAYAKLFQAAALFRIGDRGASARANQAVAAAVPQLAIDLRDTSASVPAGGRRHARFGFNTHRVLLGYRLVRSFGADGVVTRGALTPENDRAMRRTLTTWAVRNCRIAEADPGKTWRIYLSENHHAQLVAACWATADLTAAAAPATRYGDGSTAAQQRQRWTAYARAWLEQRIRYGLLEYYSPSYANYTLDSAYNYADFAPDPVLRRLATRFLDRWWADWSVQQIDGVFGGSMTRVYPKSVADGSPMSGPAWMYFGIGAQPVANVVNAAAFTSRYRPPVAVADRVRRGSGTASRCVRRSAPGRMIAHQGDWFTIDPTLPGVVRTTCVGKGFVMGSAAEPILPARAWSGGSQQNEMAAIALAGGLGHRIAIVGGVQARSNHNAMVAAEQSGEMLVKPLPSPFSRKTSGLRVWFGKQLKRGGQGGWVFVEGSARVAIRPTTGGYRWDGGWLVLDSASAGIAVAVAPLAESGGAAGFRRAVLRTTVSDTGASATYAGHSADQALRIDVVENRAPRIAGRPVDLSPIAPGL